MDGRSLVAAALALGVAYGCSSEGPEPPPVELAIELLQEGGTIHTNGTVRLEVAVTGTPPEEVRLVRNGEPWVEVDDTGAVDWDTTRDPEGRWEISAIARAGDVEATSGSVTIVVDRTPPGIQSRSPEPMEVLLADTYGISVNFTEPILLSSIDASSVRLSSGDATIQANLMLASDQRLLSVAPKGNLGEGNHRLELTDGITDLAGNRLAPTSWLWTARAAMERVDLSVDGVAGKVVITNVPIVFRVEAEGHPQKLELLRNGAAWMTMSGETYTWDLSGIFDGTFAIEARATYAFHEVMSNVLNVNVDRNPPIVSPTFKSFVSTRDLSDLQFNLSEPLLPASLNDESVLVESERGAPARRTVNYTERSWILGLKVQGTQSPDRLAVTLNQGVTDVAGNSMVQARHRLVVSDWKGLGGALNEGGPYGFHPVAASLPDGRPVVAWADQGSGFDPVGRVRVRRWTGTTWTTFPDPTDESGFIAFPPALALTPNDRPVVAWTERSMGEDEPARLNVRRWNGTVWQRLGGANLNLQPGCDASEPALGVDGVGNPVVAWTEQVTCMPTSPLPERRILVKRWTGSDWELLGAEGLPETAYAAQVAAGPNGRQGGEEGSSFAEEPAVAIDKQGGVLVAWVMDSALRVHRWTDAAWIPFSPEDPLPVPPSGTVHRRPKLAVDGAGRAIVAVEEMKLGGGTPLSALHVLRFDGEAWEPLGGEPVVSKRPHGMGVVDLVLDQTGEPIVAWGEIDSNDEGTAFVSRWNGTAWSQVGPGECFVSTPSGGGMSLAIDRNRPVLALGHDLPADYSVLVRSPE